VLYDGDVCLGGGVIASADLMGPAAPARRAEAAAVSSR
jgi:hypothetical protein